MELPKFFSLAFSGNHLNICWPNVSRFFTKFSPPISPEPISYHPGIYGFSCIVTCMILTLFFFHTAQHLLHGPVGIIRALADDGGPKPYNRLSLAYPLPPEGVNHWFFFQTDWFLARTPYPREGGLAKKFMKVTRTLLASYVFLCHFFHVCGQRLDSNPPERQVFQKC